MRQMTPRGYAFLEREEGERLHVYDDATGRNVMPGDPVVGVLTIGVGHTGPDVKPGMFITHERSRELFDKDTDWAEATVEQTCPGANDNEFDAMVSLCFNIGAQGFKGSTVARLFNKGDKTGAAKAFALWNRDKFGVNKVLVARRAREAALFLEPAASDVPKPMPQAVEAPKPPIASKTVVGTVASAAGVATIVGENAQPAIDAINTTAATITQARSAWDGIKDALSLFANGHVVTFVVLGIVLGVLVWLGVRYINKARRGDVVVR